MIYRILYIFSCLCVGVKIELLFYIHFCFVWRHKIITYLIISIFYLLHICYFSINNYILTIKLHNQRLSKLDYILIQGWIDCSDDRDQLHLVEERSKKGRSSIIQVKVRSKAKTKVGKWEGCSHKTSSIIAALRPVRLGWVAFA